MAFMHDISNIGLDAEAATGRRGDSGWLKRIDSVVGWCCRIAMGMSAAALLVSLALIGYAVFMRYVLNKPPAWVDDAVAFLLVAIVMLAAADALRKGEHIGVDLLTARLRGRALQVTSAWAMASVVVATAFLVWDGSRSVLFNWHLGVLTDGNLELSLWWIQLLVPVGGALLVAAALVGLARACAGQPSTEDSHAVPQGDEA